jgi:uncharacterized membrane protein YebE (DUF533 family)
MTADGIAEGGDHSTEAALILRCMVAIAAADGKLLGQELDLIGKIHAEFTGDGIDRGEIAEQFLRWQNEGSPSIDDVVGGAHDDLDGKARTRIFRAACHIMIADGEAETNERKRLAEIASTLDLDIGDVVETLLTLK